MNPISVENVYKSITNRIENEIKDDLPSKETCNSSNQNDTSDKEIVRDLTGIFLYRNIFIL